MQGTLRCHGVQLWRMNVAAQQHTNVAYCGIRCSQCWPFFWAHKDCAYTTFEKSLLVLCAWLGESLLFGVLGSEPNNGRHYYFLRNIRKNRSSSCSFHSFKFDQDGHKNDPGLNLAHAALRHGSLLVESVPEAKTCTKLSRCQMTSFIVHSSSKRLRARSSLVCVSKSKMLFRNQHMG
jgi:hypothetical protein